MNFILNLYKKEGGKSMARRPKEFKTTEQKLMDITNEIQIAETRLQDLKNKKKEIEYELEQEKVSALLMSIKEKHITIDKAKEIIDNISE